MSLLINIRARDRTYREVRSLLYAILPTDLRRQARANSFLLDIATNLFFIFYSVAPGVVQEPMPLQVYEAVRQVFIKNWDTFMRLRDEYGTVLDFYKSFVIALNLLKQLLQRMSVHPNYDMETNVRNLDVMLSMVLGNMKEILKEAENIKQALASEQQGSSYGIVPTRGSSSFAPMWNGRLRQDIITNLTRGILDALTIESGRSGSKRVTSVVTGVTLGSDILHAKLSEHADELISLAKYANGQLLMREYGERELSMVVVTDFSSSTTVNVATSEIRHVVAALYNTCEITKSRHKYIFFNDSYVLIEPQEVMKFISFIAANGGTNIDLAMMYADLVARRMGDDTVIVLISDCEDTVKYEPHHEVLSILFQPKAYMQYHQGCASHYANYGPQILLRPDDVFTNPYKVGVKIGTALSLA